MAGRPEVLYALFAEAATLKGVGPAAVKGFARLGVTRLRDLVFHLPSGVVDRRPVDTLTGVASGQVVTLKGRVAGFEPPRRKGGPSRVHFQTLGTAIELTFFRAGDWLKDKLPEGAERVVSGKIGRYDGRWQLTHPDLVLTVEEAGRLAPFEPVYPLAEGLTQRSVGRAVRSALDRAPALDEWLDPALKAREGWPDWRDALDAVHAPDGPAALGQGSPARRRLAYDELLSHQLALALGRGSMRRGRGRVNRAAGDLPERARRAFGFRPTAAQARALDEIRADMEAPERMMRLLQGDVGSGKTWVAAQALVLAVASGGQGALMAPTEILARQHGAGLVKLAAACGIDLVVLTGRDRGAERARKLAAIAEGRARLVVGTHALFSGDVAFADLRLAVVDEQHRFGVRQRMELTAKAPAGCDLLVMTATPIPRTLALAGYGDLDVSVLDEKPPGRRPIDTRLVALDRVDAVVARLRAAIEAGRRAYWVCPVVEDRAESDMVAAEARAAALTEALGPERVALIHGRLGTEAKDAAMAAFQSGARQVLVATTVIEVGVDVPEATIMVIEQAERFGLAQLHQLRGRVGRGGEASHCLLLYAPPLGETAAARLACLRDSEDGFRIAEEDLRLRGAGDLIGTAQSGMPRFSLADPEASVRLMEIAHDDARVILATDPDLTGPRGRALRVLLYLMERDASVRLLKSG